MLKEITLPPIDMKKFSDQTIDSNLVIMSHDFNANELVIPFYEKNVFDTYEAFYSFQGNTSIIIQEVYNTNNEIRIPIVNDVRRHKGIFTIELNASSGSTQTTLMKLNVLVKRSNIDSNSEFLFNHYYKLFEDYEKEIEDLKNGIQSTIGTQVKQTLIVINDKVMTVNDTTSDFVDNVATKNTQVNTLASEFTDNVATKNTQVNTLASNFIAEFDSLYADKSLMMDTLKVEKSNEMYQLKASKSTELDQLKADKTTELDQLYNDKNQTLTGLETKFADKVEVLEQTYVSRLTGIESGLVDLESKSIVESGSNANGNWTKLADGTMICRVTKQTNDEIVYPHGALFRTGSTRWVYPVPFLTVPETGAFPVSGASYIWASIGQSAALNSGCDFGVFSVDKRPGVKPFVSVTAIGRWK